MELQEFISESLSQILNGIEDAHSKIKSKPKFPALFHIGSSGNDNFDQKEKIEFELVVYVEDRKLTAGEAKIRVFSIGQLGGEGESKSINYQLNKIRFSVPIYLSARLTKKDD